MPQSHICDTLIGMSLLPEPPALILCSGQHREILENVACLARARHLRVAGSLAKPLDPRALLRLVDAAAGQIEAPSDLPDADRPAGFSKAMLEEAIAKGQFRIVMQPLHCVRSNSCRSAEALARWHHPEKGIIAPGLFLADLRAHGLLYGFTVSIVRQVFAWSARWQKEGRPLELAINLSPSLLSDGRMGNFLIAEAERQGVDPARIVLELTEDEILPAPEAVLDSLIRLRMHGFRLAIDDFGAEFSALNRLIWLPISIIKIDRSLTARTNANAPIVLENAIDLAHKLNMHVVAEGIEDKESFQQMQALGCDAIQGYVVARPLPPEEVMARLEAQGPCNGTPGPGLEASLSLF